MNEPLPKGESTLQRRCVSTIDVAAWIALLIPCVELLVLAFSPSDSWNATWLKMVAYSLLLFALPFVASLWYLPVKALKRLYEEGVDLKNWIDDPRVWLALMPIWVLLGTGLVAIVVIIVRRTGA